MSLLDKFENLEKPKTPTPVTKKPPMAPKKVSKTQKKSLDNNLTSEKNSEVKNKIGIKIDWIKLAQSSDFKRAVYLALEGKSFRGSNEKLDKELNKKIEVFRDPNFYGAVKEMKKMFKNGFVKPSDIIKEQEKIKNESNNPVVDI